MGFIPQFAVGFLCRFRAQYRRDFSAEVKGAGAGPGVIFVLPLTARLRFCLAGSIRIRKFFNEVPKVRNGHQLAPSF